MNELLTSILLAVSAFLGVVTLPPPSANWTVVKGWESINNVEVFQAKSQTIPQQCKENPDYTFELPQIIHGVHEIRADGELMFSSGDPTFKKVSSFFEHPIVSCALLLQTKEIEWTAYSYTKYFARFSQYPTVSGEMRFSHFFDINLNVISASLLLFLSFLTYFLFFNKIEKKMMYSLILGSFFGSIYAIMCVAPEFGILCSMLTAHKIADISLILGGVFYIYYFYQFNYASLKNLIFYIFVNLIAILFISFGKTSDTIQFGTSIFIFNSSIIVSILLVSTSRAHFSGKYKSVLQSRSIAWLSFLSILTYLLFSMNDIVHTFGVVDSYMLIPVGCVSGFFTLLLTANQQIENTYKERDALLHNLETKVQEKTKDLNEALDTLKKSQAELIQSSKLASLGTLSAGIAHEINNSINFVNGAIVPLEKNVMPFVPEKDKELIQKLFGAIRHGTDLTVQIVRSLRTFTGLNQSAFREMSVEEIITSVLTILKSKLSSIKVTLQIDPQSRFEGSQVGVSQAIMNIISNAIDALKPGEGEIRIESLIIGTNVIIKIADNGSGIPEKILSRIFDPFFTTKDVGKGTGLGLFIVKKEMDRHNGTVEIQSELNKGTTFILKFPIKTQISEIEKGVA